MTDTQMRFLRAIADRVPLERVSELYVFPARRQGTIESGVAVIAVEAEKQTDTETESEFASEFEVESETETEIETESESEWEAEDGGEPALSPAQSRSHVVYSASYKLTLKGAERGRFEADIVNEADAPLATVDEVVRGVHRRSGDGQEEAERLSGDRLRELLEAYVAAPAAPWPPRT